jgi:hypothetical protein
MKKFVKIISANLFVLLAILFIFELGLRFFWRMSALKESIYQVSANKILRYELKPKLKTVYACRQIITNAAGFRGKEYSIQKGKDTYRIVLIGDSVAFGKLLSFEDSLAVRLERALTAACAEKKFEVLNMGVEGYNSLQELEMLKVKGLKYNPDLVVVYYCFNDPEYPEYYFKKNFATEHFQLARYILHKVKKYMIKREKQKKGIKDIEDNFRYLYSTDCWRYTKEAILEMGDLTAQKGIKMVFLIVPEMSEPVKDFQQGYPFWYINEILEAIKHNNIIVIDPVREFSRRALKKEEFCAWSYPDGKANDIIAEYTLNKLRENKIIFCD